jgi:four helix bundle protein
MSYKNLEIWQLAREIALEVHKMTLEDLPKFEMYETGQQIRRSSKSCRSTIVKVMEENVTKMSTLNFLFIPWVQTMKQLTIWKNFGKQVH